MLPTWIEIRSPAKIHGTSLWSNIFQPGPTRHRRCCRRHAPCGQGDTVGNCEEKSLQPTDVCLLQCNLLFCGNTNIKKIRMSLLDSMSFQRNEMEITIKRYDKIYTLNIWHIIRCLQDVLTIFEFAKTSMFHQMPFNPIGFSNLLLNHEPNRFNSAGFLTAPSLDARAPCFAVCVDEKMSIHFTSTWKKAKPKKLQRQGHTGTCAKSFFVTWTEIWWLGGQNLHWRMCDMPRNT